MNNTMKAALALVLGVSAIAKAEPTLYPANLNVLASIKNSTDSNILADEQDAKTVWVLPPNTASAKVTGLHTPLANMLFCQDLVIARNNAAKQTERIDKISGDLAAKSEELIKLQEKASELMVQAERYNTENGLIELQGYDDRIQSAEIRLLKLFEEYSKCKDECYGIKTEIANTNEDKRKSLEARANFLAKNQKDLRDYKRKRAAAEAAKQKVSDIQSAYDQLMETFAKVRSTFLAQFSSFAAMPGAKANMLYTSHWDKNIEKLRSENPGINFSKVATKNAKLMGELAGVKGIDRQGAIQYISQGGVDHEGVVPFPQYPESISSNISLTLLGACPMVHPKAFQVEGVGDVQNMKYGIVITYDYDSIFTAKATAHYNMYKMYEKIVSSGKKGGLFRSRSWSHTEERNEFRDSFKVIWNDRENTISNEEKEAREAEMRKAVFSRLATLALPAVPNRAEILPAGQAPTRGAIVASDELMKACPGNVYCVGGAAVLRVLDAIFGSSSSSASYKQITNSDLKDEYEKTQKITKSWITSYVDATSQAPASIAK